ncbi:ATP-binding protein [Pseudofrankia saprophytica]|uniref:ATP-binding protein n=1 Tax=Pseudofrankia saprophytica TaxID=298655 RepID=UPI000234B1B9|nr:DUF87 domain-containing protein [Pseudofrankia saprophytica]
MFDGFELFQVVSVPRPRAGSADTELAGAQVFAALIGAHAELTSRAGPGETAGAASGAASPAIMVGWIRPRGERRMRFLLGGRPFFPPADVQEAVAGQDGDGPRRVLYPPGSLARPVSTLDVAADLDAFPCWLRCAGRPEALWAPEARGTNPVRRGGFDDYAAHLDTAYAWLVVAQPRPATDVDLELAHLTARIPLLRQRENLASAKVDLERAESRYRELSRAHSVGMWDVDIQVGATSAASARMVAALMCGSSDLDGLPYALAPCGPVASAPSWSFATGPTAAEGVRSGPAHGPRADTGAVDDDGPRAPFAASAELVMAIARLPRRELPGINLVLPHTFDVTPEENGGPTRSAEPGGGTPVLLGDVLDAGWAPSGPLMVSRATLNRHAFVCGATGAGKSQTVRSLLESVSLAPEPIPWLVLEPAKAEYARMAGRLAGHGEVVVIRPGLTGVRPPSLNPLEPEPGFPLQSHLDLVRALFLAAFEAHEPFPQVLARALTACYSEHGWNLVLDRPEPPTRPKLWRRGPDADPDVPTRRRYPTLGDLQRTASTVIQNIGYGAEVTADVRGFVDVRIGSLREGTPGRFFEGGHPIDIGALLTRNVVFELEDITNDQDKAFLLGAVLIRIVEHLRVRHGRGGADGLRHLLVVEEAHRLLRNVADGPAAAAVEMFAALLAEIRAYGEGVIVVEQIPAKILPDVVKNTALKVMHRLPAADDRQVVGATMNLTEEQSELVVALPPGVAAVTVDGMDRPLLVRMTPGGNRESPRLASYDGVPLAGPRSRLCPPTCAASPCRLVHMVVADRLAREPLLVVWVEAVTMHLVTGLGDLRGAPPPLLRPALAGLLSEADPEIRRCALDYCVERAIAARNTQLAGAVDPDDLADRLLALLLAQLDGTPLAPADGRRFTAGMYRWLDVRRALVEGCRKLGRDAPPHADTDLWRRRGLVLDGLTLGAQHDAMLVHRSFADGQDQVVTGNLATSRLCQAVVALTGGHTAACLDRAMHQACSGTVLDDLVKQAANLVEAGSLEGTHV